MRVRPRRAAALTCFACALAAGPTTYALVARRDARLLASDPEHAVMRVRPAGQLLTVTSADGTELHAEVFGPSDARSVVLVHGWMCTSGVWAAQIHELCADLRIVAYDQRGHGRSAPAVDGDYSSDALAADLQAVLDQTVPGGERVVLAGHSMGAMAVVAWAHAHRGEVAERLAGVALINVGVEDLVRRSTLIPFPVALATLRATLGERILGSPLPLPSRTNPVLSRLVRAVTLGPDASPASMAVCTEMLLGCPTDVRAAFGATLSTFDLAHGLPSLTVPVVIIAGQRDRLTPPVHARSIADAVPDSTLVELDGVGHVAPIEASAEVSRHLRRLAATVPGDDPPPSGDLGVGQ